MGGKLQCPHNRANYLHNFLMSNITFSHMTHTGSSFPFFFQSQSHQSPHPEIIFKIFQCLHTREITFQFFQCLHTQEIIFPFFQCLHTRESILNFFNVSTPGNQFWFFSITGIIFVKNSMSPHPGFLFREILMSLHPEIIFVKNSMSPRNFFAEGGNFFICGSVWKKKSPN